MLRATTLVSVLIALPGAAFAQANATPEAKTDTVQVHGKALPLSCAEWLRNGDGSWTNISPLLVGEETVKEVTLRGANAKPLELKCANGAPFLRTVRVGREAEASASSSAWDPAASRRDVTPLRGAGRDQERSALVLRHGRARPGHDGCFFDRNSV